MFSNKLIQYLIITLLIFSPLAYASVYDWAVIVIHMTSLVAATLFLFQKIFEWDWKWEKSSLEGPIAFMTGIVILSLIFSRQRQTSVQAVMIYVNFLILFYLFIQTVRARSDFRQMVYLIIGLAVFISIVGWVKYFGENTLSWWRYPDESSQRLSSVFRNSDHLAGYLELTVFLSFGMLMTGLDGWMRWGMIMIAIFLGLTLSLTLSRGGWAGGISGMIFMMSVLVGGRYKSKKLAIGLIVCLLLLFMILIPNIHFVKRLLTLKQKDEMSSFAYRLITWKDTLRMIRDFPVTGVGPGNFKTMFTQYQSPGFDRRFYRTHNEYLQFTSEMGLLFIPMILWLLFVFYRRGFQKLKNPSRLVRGITLGAMSGITAFLVHGLGEFLFRTPANALLFTILSAMVAAPTPVIKGSLTAETYFHRLQPE
jgi:O-antigen ligase